MLCGYSALDGGVNDWIIMPSVVDASPMPMPELWPERNSLVRIARLTSSAAASVATIPSTQPTSASRSCSASCDSVGVSPLSAVSSIQARSRAAASLMC